MPFYTSVEQLKNLLYVRGYETDGTPLSYKTSGDDIVLKLYTKDKSGRSSEKTLFQEPLKDIKFNNIEELMSFKNDFKKEFDLHGDFSIPNQYITQKHLSEDVNIYNVNCGTIDIETTSARKKYSDKHNIRIIKPGSTKESKVTIKEFNKYSDKLYEVFDEEINTWISFSSSCYAQVIGGFPNIENPQEAITVISVHSSKSELITCFTCCQEPAEPIQFDACPSNMVYCQSEKELLSKFIAYWKKESFDVITGWSSSYFDLPYLYNRMILVLSKKDANDLSFWKYVYVKTIDKMNKKTILVELLGTPHLDYIDLYKKFVASPRENYKLDTICEIELGEKKLDYSEYNSIQEFWEQDPVKFTLYNIQDVFLVVSLERKLKLLFLAMTFAYIAKENYSDIYSPVKTWESLCYNQLYDWKRVVPPMTFTGKDEVFAGAFVREAIPGMYKDVVTYDLKSLYPSIINMLNISPETLVNRILDTEIQNSNIVEPLLNRELKNYKVQHDNNLSLAANGQFYRKDQKGIIPVIMEDLMNKRDQAKFKMIELKKELEDIKLQLAECE